MMTPEHATAQDADSTDAKQSVKPIMIGTKEVAQLMGVSQPTLRNYVWLQKLPETERTRRSLQSPPKGMPRPQVIKGKNMWSDRIMRPWATKWAASRDRCTCSQKPDAKDTESETS